jgi:uncharacterized protein (TIGR00730 family)
MPTICVFCAASERIDERYRDLARACGRFIGQNQFDLVYGGTSVGLMGEVAKAAKLHGAKVHGIVPQKIVDLGICNPALDTCEVTADLRNRKALMEAHADLFLILPGSTGTWDEAFEILNHRLLGYHTKPVLFLDETQFYQPLWNWIEATIASGFTRKNLFAEFHRFEDQNTCWQWIKTHFNLG